MRDWIISARDAKRTHVTATKLYGRIEALTESAIAMRSLARNHRPVGYYGGCLVPWQMAGARRGGEPMNPADQSSHAHDPAEIADQIDEAALAEVMRVTPLGAGVLAGTAVALLVLGYLAIYFLVFLPRGTVG